MSRMGQKGEAIRARIVEAADDLFYRQGFDKTSFSDIADAVRISRGNFYYHFKTKDAILKAVIEKRLDDVRLMLHGWDREYPEPRERLKRFVQILIVEEDKIEHFGCPMGSLCIELSKLKHASRDSAGEMFAVFGEWLESQLVLLGHEQEAHEMALRLLARCQGSVVIANAFHDKDFLRREVAQLDAWIDSL